MFVKGYMTAPAVTIGGEESLLDARRLMEENRIRHLPVTDGSGLLLGIVTDRDLRSSWPSIHDGERGGGDIQARLGEIPVREIMTADPQKLVEDSTLDDALFILEEEKIGALPVVDDEGKVRGIISVQDLLKAYKDLFGLRSEGSVLLAVEDDGTADLLSRLIGVLKEKEVSFSRLIRTEGEAGERGVVYLRANTYNVHLLRIALGRVGLKVRQ